MEDPFALYKPLYEPLPLDQSGNEIRLLHVSPSAEHDAPICCALSVHVLDEHLHFNALSYEWGRFPDNSGDKHFLVVNGLTLPVQANLSRALRHLRRREGSLVIWVDAICINQKDSKEKPQQVGLMSQLYGRASQTFAWLGLGTDDSDVAMATLDKVGRGMLVEDGEGMSAMRRFGELTDGAAAGEWNKQSPDELLKLAPHLVNEYLPSASFCTPQCRALLSRSYWARMWIQQEVVISSKVVVCCGKAMVDWESFEAGLVFVMLLMHHAIYGVISKYTNTEGKVVWDFSAWTENERKNYEQLGPGWAAEAAALRRMRRRYPRGKAPPAGEYSLMRVVTEAHGNSNVRYELSQQEDRVYGLVGIAADIPDLQWFGFRIAYGVPCSESYTNAARAIILSGGVDLLALSNFPKFERMPSWVPDWRMPTQRPRGGYPWETDFCVAKGLEGPDNIGQHKEWDDPLVLEGCIVDYVDHMNAPWRPGAAGCRIQNRATRGYLLDVQNIIWMSGERQGKLGKWVYDRDGGADNALARMPVADQLQAGTSVQPGEKATYLCHGYVGVMEDLDKDFVLDTRMWATFRQFFGVKFEGFPDPKDMKPFVPTKDSTAKFNMKDSYYDMMNRQSGTRPFLGDKGYMGLVPELTEKGDAVVIFKNAKFPYVLRKKTNGKHAGKYELVGEAYVHGIMYGEFVANGPKFQHFELA